MKNKALAHGLMNGMRWSETSEGGGYWNMVHNLALGEHATVPPPKNNPETRKDVITDREEIRQAVLAISAELPYLATGARSFWRSVQARLVQKLDGCDSTASSSDVRLLLEADKMRN